MQFVVDGLLFVLLLTMTIFMLVNHLRLQKFIRESSEMPYLTEQFTKTLEKAQQTMRDLVQASGHEGVILNKQIEQATKLSTEIDYLLHRAEKQIQKMEDRTLMFSSQQVKPDPVVLSSVDAFERLAQKEQQNNNEALAEAPSLFAKEEAVGKAAIKPAGAQGIASAYATVSHYKDDEMDEVTEQDERAFLTSSPSSYTGSAQDKLRLALEEALK